MVGVGTFFLSSAAGRRNKRQCPTTLFAARVVDCALIIQILFLYTFFSFWKILHRPFEKSNGASPTLQYCAQLTQKQWLGTGSKCGQTHVLCIDRLLNILQVIFTQDDKRSLSLCYVCNRRWFCGEREKGRKSLFFSAGDWSSSGQNGGDKRRRRGFPSQIDTLYREREKKKNGNLIRFGFSLFPYN